MTRDEQIHQLAELCCGMANILGGCLTHKCGYYNKLVGCTNKDRIAVAEKIYDVGYHKEDKSNG